MKSTSKKPNDENHMQPRPKRLNEMDKLHKHMRGNIFYNDIMTLTPVRACRRQSCKTISKNKNSTKKRIKITNIISLKEHADESAQENNSSSQENSPEIKDIIKTFLWQFRNELNSETYEKHSAEEEAGMNFYDSITVDDNQSLDYEGSSSQDIMF